MEPKRASWRMPVITAVAVAVAIVISFIGSGALGGTPINEAAGGALSADATPFAPDGPAFSIWSVVYLGLVAYAIFQLLPQQRISTRQAALRPWVAASALLNAAWILMIQANSVFTSVAVIVVLLAVLVRILNILKVTKSTSWFDTLVSDGTFGLYLGWVWVAMTANIAAYVAATGMTRFTGWQWVAVGVLAIVALAGIGVAFYSAGRLAPALAITWGLAWVAVARTTGDFASPVLVWGAAIAAALVLIGTVIIRFMIRRPRSLGDQTS